MVLHLAARVPPFDACPAFFPDVAALVNDKEVSDHHALIPTLELEKMDVPALPVGERNILLLVCCKLLCAAAEPIVYEAVTATFDCGGHTFTIKGKQVLSQGWRAIQEVFRSSLKEKPEDEDAEDDLPTLTEGQVFESVAASVTEHFTSPPKPYTEDTLLSAMENAGKEDMSRSKKWRLEWAFFLGENGRRQYNKLCKGCVHPCKQSFRAVVFSCPNYLSRRSKKCGN